MATRPVKETLQEYARGVAGGLLFAVAPLYTMEIWRQSYLVTPALLMVSVGLMLGALVAYAYYAGLHDDKSFPNNVLEALETLAIGAVLAIGMLKLIGQLPPDLGFNEAFGRIVTETLAVSVGVAVGSSQLGEGSGDEEEEDDDVWSEIAYAALGALLLAVGLAPTQEIVVVAVAAPPAAVLGTAVLSFLLVLGMVRYADFRGSGRFSDGGVFAGGPLGDAFVTYGIALAVAAALLWLGGGLAGFALPTVVAQVVFLSVATALGASAGRLLLS